MKQPWLKFYPADWRQDPALRMCSLAARGMWIEMLCLMWQADPCGSLLINSKQISARQLAPLIGTSVKEAETLFAELREAGVFSEDTDGTIYSRRMRKDVDKAERDKRFGSKGGNPSLKRGVNPADNLDAKGGDKAQKLEARSQKPDLASLDRARSRLSPNDLARKLHDAAGGRVDHTSPAIEVIGPMQDLIALGCDLDRHILPTIRRIVPTLEKPLRTWGARWLRDEILAVKALDTKAADTASDEPRVDFGGGYSAPHETIRKLWAEGNWLPDWGPKPGEAGCRVPPELLADIMGNVAA